MNCKYCNAPLEDGVTVCPACGKALQEEVPPEEIQKSAEEAAVEENLAEEVPAEENVSEEASGLESAAEELQKTADEAEKPAEANTEAPSKKKKTGKIVAAVVGCVVLAAILIGAVLYGLGIDLGPRANDVMYKDNYTVSDEYGEKASDIVVATAGGKSLTNAELQIYYWYSVDNFLSYYGNYLSYVGLDSTKPLEDQIYDAETGMTWQQYFLKNALESWNRYAALELMAEAEGYTLDEQTQESIDTLQEQVEDVALMYGYESGEQMLKEDWSAVCNMAGYTSYLETNVVSMNYYNDRYEQLQPTAEEVEAYFTENKESYGEISITKDSGKYVDVRHILFTPEGGTENEDGTVTYSDEEWEACRIQAQDMLDQWLAGDATEESFAQLATENTQDPGSASTGGLYTDVTVGQMVEPFENWCFDETRQAGDSGLVQTNYGYHVMYFVESRDIWYVTAQGDLITQRTEALLQEGIERWPAKVNYKKIVLGDMYSAEAEETTE